MDKQSLYLKTKEVHEATTLEEVAEHLEKDDWIAVRSCKKREGYNILLIRI